MARKEALLEHKAANLRQQMQDEEQAHQRRSALGTTKLQEEQKAQMAAAKTTAEDARRARDAAQLELEKFERVFATPGGGGVSLLQVESRETRSGPPRMPTASRKRRLRNWQPARNRTSWRPRMCSSEAGAARQADAGLRAATKEIDDSEKKLRLQLNTARAEAEAASRISFETSTRTIFS